MMIPPPIPSRPESRPGGGADERQPPAHARRSPSSSSATRRSCGVVTLKFSGVDSTTRTVPPARSTSQASSVAWASVAASTSSARSSASRRNACGVWIAHRRERSCVATTRRSVARLLDRVGHRRGGDRGVGVRQRGERGGEVLGRHERPRRVVDDDLVGGRRRRQRAAHRLRAGRPAGHARRSRPAPPHPAAARRRCPRSPPPAARRRSTPASGDRRERRTPWADRRQGVRHSPRPPAGRPPRSESPGGS